MVINSRTSRFLTFAAVKFASDGRLVCQLNKLTLHVKLNELIKTYNSYILLFFQTNMGNNASALRRVLNENSDLNASCN